MLSSDQLRGLLADHEFDPVEFMESTGDTDKFGEAICALANDFPNNRQPGYLLVGVNDQGSSIGLTVTDDLLRRLSDLQSNVNLEPLPALSVQKHVLPKGEVAVVEVTPSDLPPVRYKGRVWIRVGPSRRSANQQQERFLVERRAALPQPFDARPCHDAGVDELVPGLFVAGYLPTAIAADVIAENNRDVREQMASLRFYDPDTGSPTNAAVLLFGKDPLRWMPGAWVQYARWDGDTMGADVIEEKQFRGDLFGLFRELDGFVKTLIRVRPVADSALHERIEADYPAVAVRELLLNAIMHRSYETHAPVYFYWFSNRIEIISPGGLYGMASPENFPNRTDYRNPVLSAAMATLGYVNRFGRGVIRAQEALQRNGNPAAEFELHDPANVLATIRGKS